MPTIKQIRKTQPKSANNLDKYFHRFISAYTTKFFLSLNLTGNQVTIIWILTGIISSLFFLKGSYFLSLIGALILLLSFILNFSDGEVARYNKQTSVNGFYLDCVGHFIVTTTVITAISFALFYKFSSLIFLIFGFSTIISLLLIRMASTEKYEVLQTTKTKPKKSKKQTKSDLIVLLNPVYLILIFSIFNLLPLLITLYGIFLPLFFIRKLYKEFKYGF
ncbi:hypothetical protein CL618_03300 [archaeon]|nr:hypothetical protein [archaeon]|tara:strand:+ start:270 stop:929 length:660 start_codon:yes stop_codon:yes gene_type:complete